MTLKAFGFRDGHLLDLEGLPGVAALVDGNNFFVEHDGLHGLKRARGPLVEGDDEGARL